METINAIWFNPLGFQGVIGIVLVKVLDGHKAYIGIGAGFDERVDMNTVAQQGARFNHGEAFWPHIKDWVQ